LPEAFVVTSNDNVPPPTDDKELEFFGILCLYFSGQMKQDR